MRKAISNFLIAVSLGIYLKETNDTEESEKCVVFFKGEKKNYL